MTDIQLPAPLVPADCELKDFKFMPLDVQRLRDSDLASDETPEACWAAVLLWCASWHQIPCASVPDNDQWLAKHAGYVSRGKIAKEWPEVKEGAMRGWIKCSDGRFYHPVVAEKAIEAWNSKLDQRWRNECGRIKKHNERHETDVHKPTFEEWMSQGCPVGHRLPVPSDKDKLSSGQDGGVPSETGSKRQGEGQGQGKLTHISSSLRSEETIPKSVTFKVWGDRLKAKGESAITGYKTVFDYCQKVGIPQEWLQYAWNKFKERYTEDEKAKRKKYTDWRGVFLRAVKGNWFALWAVNREGQYYLTTVGQQAEREYRDAA